MRMEMRGEVIIGLCLCMLLFFCPVPQAADYTYGDYYNKQLTTTSTGNTRDPSISGKGDKIVFWSDQDIVGNGNNTNQVFIWTSPSGFTQISSNDPGLADVNNTLPSINFTGNRVAYIKLTWAMFAEYLMLWKSNESTEIIAIGAFTDIDSCKISGNGTKVAFRADQDFIGGLDDSYQLYLWEDGLGVTTKITSTRSSYPPDTSFSISYDGTLAAFATQENNSPYSGTGNTYRIYMWNKSGSTLAPITNTTSGTGSIEPSITSYTISTTTGTTSMTKIAFSSDRDLLVGKNPDNNPEIFLWTIYGSYTSTNTGSYTQITSTSVSGGACRNPQISRDGKFVTFVSNVDILSGGTSKFTPSTSAIFVWNANGVITQVNSSGDNPVIASYTGLKENDTIQYGPRIAYYSTVDGSDDIYLATSTIPVPATSRWGLIILILVLVSLAVFMLIRKRRSARGEA